VPGSDYDFWLLDLDGTVVDVRESYVREVVDAVGDRLGAGFGDREAHLIWYGPDEGRAGVFERKGLDPDRFWDVFHEVDRPGARAEASYVYDDAAATVPDLAGPVGVVTHCQEYLTGPVLDALDIGDWFDTVVCCSHETGWKPDPAPVEMAVADLGVRGDRRGAMAGDDPRDVLAAHNAGLDGIHVARPDHPATEGSDGAEPGPTPPSDATAPTRGIEEAPRVRSLHALTGDGA
jgi:phosphoglycolate phosphatase